jgi:hypothetical protein
VGTSTRYTDSSPRPGRIRELVRALVATAAAVPALALALPVAILATPFLLVSRVTRLIASAMDARVTPWAEVLREDPEVGWQYRPDSSVTVHNMNGDTFRFETDAEGWRGRLPLDDAELLVFGDSFAFGYSVDEDAYFGSVPGPARIKGLGVLGYSMVQPLLWMERLRDRLRGKTVVWLVYEGNDLDDALRPETLGRRAPFLHESPAGNGWEVRQPAGSSPWPFPLQGTNYERFVDICCGSPYAERVFSAAEYLIRRGRDCCKAAQADLVVVKVPELSPIQLDAVARTLALRSDADAFDPDLPDRRLREICDRVGVEFVSLKGRLSARDYLRRDVHWNVRGNRRFAAILQELYATRERPAGPRENTGAEAAPESAVVAGNLKAAGGAR